MTKPLPYEKALALKQAGWPQPDRGKSYPGEFVSEPCPNLAKPFDIAKVYENTWLGAYSPSLEELIEGCLPEIEEYHFRLDWYRPGHDTEKEEPCADAYYVKGFGHTETCRFEAYALTPKEAVCDLWLSLPPELRVKP